MLTLKRVSVGRAKFNSFLSFLSQMNKTVVTKIQYYKLSKNRSWFSSDYEKITSVAYLGACQIKVKS